MGDDVCITRLMYHFFLFKVYSHIYISYLSEGHYFFSFYGDNFVFNT